MLIGVDLGGTNIKVGAVNQKGEIVYQNIRPTNPSRGYELIIQDIIEQIEGVLAQMGLPIEDIQSIGIGIPGLSESVTGRVIYCTNLFWYDIPLGEKIKIHFQRPVYVENDATVAALAESISGSTKGLSNSVFLTIGTGVGGGIIINNKVYSGSHGAGSEIGHMIVGENFYSCNCGQNGCLETFVSATGMIRYAQKRIHEGVKDTEILHSVNNKLEDINGKVIFDAAQKGDPLGAEVVERAVNYLATGIINIYNLLDPERIAIGGGISRAGNLLLNPLREAVHKRVFCKDVNYGDIALAQLGNDAGIIGAAFLG
ncbi:MAG: ROK family glucokinase [Thermotaleaceae bacterium]